MYLYIWQLPKDKFKCEMLVIDGHMPKIWGTKNKWWPKTNDDIVVKFVSHPNVWKPWFYAWRMESSWKADWKPCTTFLYESGWDINLPLKSSIGDRQEGQGLDDYVHTLSLRLFEIQAARPQVYSGQKRMRLVEIAYIDFENWLIPRLEIHPVHSPAHKDARPEIHRWCVVPSSAVTSNKANPENRRELWNSMGLYRNASCLILHFPAPCSPEAVCGRVC